MFGRLCLKEVAKDMVVPKPVEEEKSSHKASVSSQVFVVNSRLHVSGFSRHDSVRGWSECRHSILLLGSSAGRTVSKRWLIQRGFDLIILIHAWRSFICCAQSFVIWNGCNLSGQGQNEEVA